MSSHVQHFDTASFDQTLLTASQTILVDFHADWCPPCQVLGPIVDEIAADYAGRVTVGKVDVDGNAELAQRFSVQTIPTVLLIVDGKVIERFVGIQPKEDVASALDRALAHVAA